MTSFTGTVAIRAMKDNDYQATIFPGTRDGLQAAIDSFSGGKGKVSIGPGTLLLASAINLASNVTLEGCGIGQTVLKHSGTTLHTMLSASSKNDFIVQDMTIDGDQTGISTYNADRWLREETVDLATCTGVTLRDVEITACRGQGIYGTSCSRVQVRDCWIHDTDNWGAVFKVADDVDFIGNHVETAYTHGLYVDAQTSASGSTRVRFLGNTVINVQHDSAHAASGVGISVQVGSTGGVYDVECIGNYAKNNGSMGFSMTPGGRTAGFVGKMIVAGNHSEGHTSTGGSAGSGHGYEFIATNVICSDNVAKNNTYHFTVDDGQDLVIRGNKTISAVGSSQIGVLLTASSSTKHTIGLIVEGNLFYGGTGFQIDTSAPTTPHTDLTVCGNQFIHQNFSVFMQGDGLNVAIVGNLVDANNGSVSTGRGIQVSGDKITVANNHIWANATSGDGIVVNSGQTTDQLILSGNHIFSCRFGMNFAGTTTTVLANGNMISGAGTADSSNKSNVTNWRDGGNNSWNFKTATPATEHWHIGTKVYDTAVAPSSFIGWVCTTAGTPGTWKTWGATSA